MSSFQPQQLQPQQVQPVVVYPNNPLITNQPDSSSSSSSHHRHSNGSFGTVFIVLAIIAVVSAIACLLGRLCNRRISGGHVSQKHSNNNHHKSKSQSSQNSRPNKDQTRVHELARAKDHHHQQQQQQGHGDIELGNSNARMNKEEQLGDQHIEFGFDNLRSSTTSAAPNGKPAVTGSNGHGHGMRSGSRGHVAFETTRNGNHATVKHHGGDHHDYHGGPRASD